LATHLNIQQFSDQQATPHHSSTPSPHSILWLTQLEIAVSSLDDGDCTSGVAAFAINRNNDGLLRLLGKGFMKFSLSQYPAAIAQASQVVNDLEQQVAEVRQHIARLEGNADLVVAFEPALKNDNQRKARRFEVLQINYEYQRAVDALNHLATEKANALARLEQLRNEFSVAKLETRLAIAQRLIGIESKELVGL
jgi:hypothetical protein